MSTNSARRNPTAPDTRTAGGKIIKSRRPPAASRTPYSRPSAEQREENESVEDEVEENPNWLSNLIYPAKVIASGAGKILSFFGNYDDSSDNDDSQDESENDDDEIENDESDKVLSPSMKSENKLKIEELVMEETFSREEGNALIKLIKSRIVDSDGGGTPQARTSAIMEARKWLQEKRSGSKKKLETDPDWTPPHLNKGGKGSPVDMAKSYMQNRPAWESPSLKQGESDSPTTLNVARFREETPSSTLRGSELKRSSLASGSWNLLEEIRRVRTKATEEFLATTPFKKSSLSLVSHENKPPQDIMEVKGDEKGAGPTDIPHITTETAVPDAAANVLSVNQGDDTVQSREDQVHLEAADLKSKGDNEENELRSMQAENGSVYSSSGLFQGQDAAQRPGPSDGTNGKLIGSTTSSHGERDLHVDDSNPDAPSTIPADTAVNGSQNSCSLQEEDFFQEHSQPTVDGLSAKLKPKDAPKERKSRGYTRRGRGRGNK